MLLKLVSLLSLGLILSDVQAEIKVTIGLNPTISGHSARPESSSNLVFNSTLHEESQLGDSTKSSSAVAISISEESKDAVTKRLPPLKAMQPGLSEGELLHLVDQLSASGFQDRLHVMKALLQEGEGAIPYLIKAAKEKKPEVGLRVVLLLDQLHHSSDLDETDAAEAALITIQDECHAVVSHQANRVLLRNFLISESRAVSQVKKLGGIFHAIQMPGTNRFGPGAGIGGVPAQPLQGNVAANWAQQQTLILNRNWKGGDAGLQHVKRMRRLGNAVIVKDSGISAKAIEELKTSLPQTRIDERGKAFLGVTMDQAATGCFLRNVTKGSAADKAGLLPGDVIRSIDGKPTPAPSVLIERIGDYQPGDKIQLEITRSGHNHKQSVVLGTWGDFSR